MTETTPGPGSTEATLGALFVNASRDLSALVRHLLGAEPDRTRRTLLSEAIDAIDDGLAGDAVAQKLATARSALGEAGDPVELLSRKVRQMVGAG